MSILQFSESTNKTGLYEAFQDKTNTNSTSYSAYKFARDANSALADYFMLAVAASGKWQVDDTNQTDYPEIKVNLVSSQFDYPLTTDASSTPNQILDIERVEVANSTAGTTFNVLEAYDEMDGDSSIVFGRTITGVPYRYSKRANGIFLDPTPSFSCTNGIRIFYARTPSYFAGTDTTKVAGIPDAHQEYLVYRPAYLYCVKNIPELASGYYAILKDLEKRIKLYYSQRNRDEHRGISTYQPNYL